MKTKLISALSAALLIATGAAYAQDNMSGEQIAQKVHDTNKSAQGVVLKGKMTLAGVGGGASESRSMVLLAYDNGGLSNGASCLQIHPTGEHNAYQCKEGAGNLQYLYLPSVGSARQIEGSDREKNFVDTDFSNEDLGGSRISDYTYNRLPDRKAGTFDCYVIERFPKNRSSKYSKHVVTIDKATMIPIDVQFYAKSGRVVKSMRASNIKQISGNIRVPMYLQVVDIEKKHQTIINVSHAEEKNINRGYFNRNRLNMQWAEQ
jgi:outer membrane lipoprotein-sorting protein